MEGGGIITMIVAVRAHLSSCSYGNKTKTPQKKKYIKRFLLRRERSKITVCYPLDEYYN